MNVVSLGEAALVGFLVSLIVLEGVAPLVRRHWPAQEDGLQLETRLLPWVLAVIAGPALFFDATGEFRRGRAGTLLDIAFVWLLLGVWSLSYGVALSWGAKEIAAVILT